MFDRLLTDPDISNDFNQDWAKIDNYQIYSLIIFDNKFLPSFDFFTPGNISVQNVLQQPQNVKVPQYGQPIENPRIESLLTWDFEPAPKVPESTGQYSEYSKIIAFQSFSPLKKITFDIASIAKQYPIKGESSITEFSNDINKPDGIKYAADEFANIRHLWDNYSKDNRVKPSLVRCLATKTRQIEYSYYRPNRLETHPSVLATLDWRYRNLQVKKGEYYTIAISDIMLGSLVTDALTKAEISSSPVAPNTFPNACLFAESVDSLMAYWNGLRQFPNINPNNTPYLNSYWNAYYFENEPPWIYPFLQNNGWHYISGLLASPSLNYLDLLPPFIYIKSRYSIEYLSTITRIVAATNNKWNHDSVTLDENLPDINHYLFQVNEFDLFEKIQQDGSFGDLTMDSPRILEIHAALNAGKYAVNDLDPDVPRVTNLGYWIEKAGNLLGHRPDANGNIDHDREKSQYSRKRIANPVFGKSQYSLNQFGKRGMVIPHLPNTYSKAGKLERLYDVVYDIPQLLQAQHDQVDIAQGIQHASQIRVKLSDGTVRSFPDLLSLQIETLRIANSMQESVTRTQVSSLVTGAEVRGLFEALGTPVSQKYLTFKDPVAKRTLQIPYFGHQSGKESVMGGIGGLKINGAIQNGILLPKSQPAKNKLNPFSVLKKKA